MLAEEPPTASLADIHTVLDCVSARNFFRVHPRNRHLCIVLCLNCRTMTDLELAKHGRATAIVLRSNTCWSDTTIPPTGFARRYASCNVAWTALAKNRTVTIIFNGSAKLPNPRRDGSG